MLYAVNNKLLCYIGDYDYGTPFEIPYIPKNQKINFNLKFNHIYSNSEDNPTDI